MRITVMGAGYVGLVTGSCLAELGNEVVCLDTAVEKIEMLQSGIVPIYEPGLDDMIRRNQNANRIRFTVDVKAAVTHGEICFIAVGTPPRADGGADVRHVLTAAREIGRWMNEDKVVVVKATAPVGTADKLRSEIAQELQIRVSNGSCSSPCPRVAVVSNPEFLKEGAAIEDFMRPDRVVLGVGSTAEDQAALHKMNMLYASFNRHHDRTLVMTNRAAELTKYAANAMLATRISFMNELAHLAELVDVDIESVRRGIGSDPRIGYSFLYAGAGYGGSCFPKDVQALQQTARENGTYLRVLDAVARVNQQQKRRMLEKIVAHFGENLRGRTIAVWGLAFKPGTDDMREAPSRTVIAGLLKRGANVRAHDPVANKTAFVALRDDLEDSPHLWPRLAFFDDASETTLNADALVIMTEWKSFRSPNFKNLKENLLNPLIFDGRNLFEPPTMAEAGFTYYGIGRTGIRGEDGTRSRQQTYLAA